VKAARCLEHHGFGTSGVIAAQDIRGTSRAQDIRGTSGAQDIRGTSGA